MDLRGKKLGLLVLAAPQARGFQHALKLAEVALRRDVVVYLYCIDEAVRGVDDPKLQALKAQGLHLYACAYGAQRRSIPVSEAAVFAGLGVVSDMMASTDRFVSFN